MAAVSDRGKFKGEFVQVVDNASDAGVFLGGFTARFLELFGLGHETPREVNKTDDIRCQTYGGQRVHCACGIESLLRTGMICSSGWG